MIVGREHRYLAEIVTTRCRHFNFVGVEGFEEVVLRLTNEINGICRCEYRARRTRTLDRHLVPFCKARSVRMITRERRTGPGHELYESTVP